MSAGWSRVIVWVPRVLGLLFVGFISLFALDVFAEGAPLGRALIGLVIHLLPSFLIVIGIAIAWRQPLVGGLVLIALAGVALWFFGPESATIVTIPLAVLGALFVIVGLLVRRTAAAGA